MTYRLRARTSGMGLLSETGGLRSDGHSTSYCSMVAEVIVAARARGYDNNGKSSGTLGLGIGYQNMPSSGRNPPVCSKGSEVLRRTREGFRNRDSLDDSVE